MAIKTLNEIVDLILSALDSDPVDSIEDTEESRQVADIVENTYFKLVDSREWPFLFNFFQLTPVGASSPTAMTLGTNVSRIKYIKYAASLTSYLEVQKFMNLLDARDTGDANVTGITDSTGVELKIITDANPTYYTILQDTRVIFDSYDSAVDTTSLVAAKTQGYGQIYPTFTRSDAFTMTLPTDMYTLLLEDAKSTAFLVLKQAANPKADFHANALKATQLEAGWKGRKNHPIGDRTLQALSSAQAPQQRGNE